MLLVKSVSGFLISCTCTLIIYCNTGTSVLSCYQQPISLSLFQRVFSMGSQHYFVLRIQEQNTPLASFSILHTESGRGWYTESFAWFSPWDQLLIGSYMDSVDWERVAEVIQKFVKRPIQIQGYIVNNLNKVSYFADARIIVRGVLVGQFHRVTFCIMQGP